VASQEDLPDADHSWQFCETQAQVHELLVKKFKFYMQKHSVEESQWLPQLNEVISRHSDAPPLQ